MRDYDQYQRTTENVKDTTLEENRKLKRKLDEKTQSFELVKMVHFDKSIDLETLNDIIIGCTGCLHSMMIYKRHIITDLKEDNPLYQTVLDNLERLSKETNLFVSDHLVPDYTLVMYPVSSSQMLLDHNSVVKNIIMLYPSRMVNEEVLDFVRSFMIVNEVLVNIVLTRDRMIELIEIDPLTKALNRASWNHHLEQIIHESSPYFMLIMDIDRFKEVNDTYGHQKGDDVLKFTGAWLRSMFRGEDKIFRLGGDEFAVIGTVNLELKDRLIEKLNRLNENYKKTIKSLMNLDATISAGVLITEKMMQENEIFLRTDHLLYESKNSGRDKVTLEVIIE